MTIHLIYLFYYCRGAEAEAAVRWRQSCMSRAAGGVTRLVIAGTIWLHRPHLDITLGPASFQVSEIWRCFSRCHWISFQRFICYLQPLGVCLTSSLLYVTPTNRHMASLSPCTVALRCRVRSRRHNPRPPSTCRPWLRRRAAARPWHGTPPVLPPPLSSLYASEHIGSYPRNLAGETAWSCWRSKNV
jgi:hypothetical protein